MLLFCPLCSNLLLIQIEPTTQMQEFFCQACPYSCPIQTAYSSKHELQRKNVDDVLGGADAWENVDATDATCPKCEHGRAFFMQIQIRSSDEASTLFFLCCKCRYQWREG